MRKNLIRLVLAVVCFSAAGWTAWAQTLSEILKKEIPQVVTAQDTDGGDDLGFVACSKIQFRQQVDASDPSAGTFLQEAVVCLRDWDAPTLFYTRGYANDTFEDNPENDLAKNLKSNIVYVEHRYFGHSKVAGDKKWKYLTIRRSADDLHAIYTAFKDLFQGPWVSTGTSKDGETAVYYTYFYPDDMTVTTAFCSPFLKAKQDDRIGRYLLEQSGSKEERENMHALLDRMLTEDFYHQHCAYLTRNKGFKKDDLSEYSIYVESTLNAFFHEFSHSTAAERRSIIPHAKASESELNNFLGKDIPDARPDGDHDDYDDYPYTVQLYKEMGCYTYPFENLSVLKGTSFSRKEVEEPDLEDEDMWIADKFDNRVVKAVLNKFLPKTDCPILLVYSKDDPWTGGRPEKVSPSVKILINPNGVHDDDINELRHYSASVRKEIVDFVRENLR